MGKGTILSGGAAGQYNVRLDFDVTRLTAEVAKLNTLISEIDVTTLPALQLALLDAQTAKDAALTAVDLAIEAFRAGTGTLEQLEKKQTELVQAAAAVDRAQLAVNNTIGRKLSLEKRRAALQAVPVSETVSAWCADLTENLTGAVGTIEIPGQRAGVPVLIRPGYNNAAVYNAARDGQLQPVQSSTPNAAFVNYALLPGWQKWKPLYRLGTISNINKPANTCTVTLDSAHSTAQGLNVNAQSVYDDVPVVYMSCNAKAFEDGDRVIVEFSSQDYTNPAVIGFESDPKTCGFSLYPEEVSVESDPYDTTGISTVSCVDSSNPNCPGDDAHEVSQNFSHSVSHTKQFTISLPDDNELIITETYSNIGSSSYSHRFYSPPWCFGPGGTVYDSGSASSERKVILGLPWDDEFEYFRETSVSGYSNLSVVSGGPGTRSYDYYKRNVDIASFCSDGSYYQFTVHENYLSYAGSPGQTYDGHIVDTQYTYQDGVLTVNEYNHEITQYTIPGPNNLFDTQSCPATSDSSQTGVTDTYDTIRSMASIVEGCP